MMEKGVMFHDDKNGFPISFTMTASFLATQAIWPTFLRLPGALDQGDSCLHLRLCSLSSKSERGSEENLLMLLVLENWSCPLEKLRSYHFLLIETNVLLC